MISNILIQLGHQRTLAVPLMRADNMHLTGSERIGSAHDRSDIEIMRPVLNSNFTHMPSAPVKVMLDRLNAPVPVAIHHITGIAFIKQLRVIPKVLRVRPRLPRMFGFPWAYADLSQPGIARCHYTFRIFALFIHDYRSA